MVLTPYGDCPRPPLGKGLPTMSSGIHKTDNLLWCESAGGVFIFGPETRSSLDKCLVIPSYIGSRRVIGIGGAAFKDCRKLKQVVLPPTLTWIGKEAFFNCVNLQKVEFSSGINSIGYCAFRGCTSLRKVVVPSKRVSVDPSAFDSYTSVVYRDGSSSARSGARPSVKNQPLPKRLPSSSWCFSSVASESSSARSGARPSVKNPPQPSCNFTSEATEPSDVGEGTSFSFFRSWKAFGVCAVVYALLWVVFIAGLPKPGDSSETMETPIASSESVGTRGWDKITVSDRVSNYYGRRNNVGGSTSQGRDKTSPAYVTTNKSDNNSFRTSSASSLSSSSESSEPSGVKNAYFTVNGEKYALCWIHAGYFMMGSQANERGHCADEGYYRVVNSGFWALETPVTQRLWKGVTGSNPSRFTDDDLPVEQVSYDDCLEFLSKLNAQVKGPNDMEFRLPTEVEWECACRGGQDTAFWWGDSSSASDLNCEGVAKQTTPVKKYSSNAYGLFDTHGNVREWCADWYAAPSQTGAGSSDAVAKETERVVRGGSWKTRADECRSASRGHCVPTTRSDDLGFRIVVGPVNVSRRAVSPSPRAAAASAARDTKPNRVDSSATRQSASSSRSGSYGNTRSAGSTPSNTSRNARGLFDDEEEDFDYYDDDEEDDPFAKNSRSRDGFLSRFADNAKDDDGFLEIDPLDRSSSWNYSGRLRPEDDDDVDSSYRDYQFGYTKDYGPMVKAPQVARLSAKFTGGWDSSEKRDIGIGKVFTIGGNEYVMRWIPPGWFMMGEPEDSNVFVYGDYKQHEVKLTRGFWILETPVTQGLWADVMGDGKADAAEEDAELPVVSVCYDDCLKFLNKLESLGLFPAGTELRLPTEAEWEYACRADSTSGYSWGEEPREGKANFAVKADDSALTPVKTYSPNKWNLYDMHGNVWEWCLDWSDVYPVGKAENPKGPEKGYQRVCRGGSWKSRPEEGRSGSRGSRYAAETADDLGFRFVLSVDPEKKR